MIKNKCILVADIGINANGDLNNVFKLISICKNAGVDFIKFQKRDVYKIFTTEELNKPKESPWGKTYGEYKNKLEFNKKEYDKINEYCINSDIKWFASPWDVNSVRFLTKYDIPYIKLASAMITDFELIEEIKSTKLPVIISTGMSTKNEVDKIVKYLGSQIKYILSCTSTYPTPSHEINLNFIKTLKNEYKNYKIGFSNHSSGINFILSSAALGAEMIEFHVTLDRTMFGTDQASSIEPQGIYKITKSIKDIEIGLGDGKWNVFPGEIPIRNKLRRN